MHIEIILVIMVFERITFKRRKKKFDFWKQKKKKRKEFAFRIFHCCLNNDISQSFSIIPSQLIPFK